MMSFLMQALAVAGAIFLFTALYIVIRMIKKQ
ncbi:hypothetical protein RKD52_002792 [Metabacillus sp. SLBN-84]